VSVKKAGQETTSGVQVKLRKKEMTQNDSKISLGVDFSKGVCKTNLGSLKKRRDHYLKCIKAVF